MCIKNIATVGKFSSDRTIQNYCDDIWKAVPVHIPKVKDESMWQAIWLLLLRVINSYYSAMIIRIILEVLYKIIFVIYDDTDTWLQYTDFLRI